MPSMPALVTSELSVFTQPPVIFQSAGGCIDCPLRIASMSDSPETSCGCHTDEKRAVSDPAYRRALWTVVVLNLGFGVIEAVGGFIAGSQALKADSLDFLGDGSITFVGLLALGWKARSRAKVALTQGFFLAALGVGVIGMAVWRAWNAIPPEFEIMGALGMAGLVVNVSAALALAKFRNQGDANARAIWLFSRNDALANIAVIIAAVLVAGFNNAWPDLIAAGVIAVLFLHSAWEIIRDSLEELREPQGPGGSGGTQQS